MTTRSGLSIQKIPVTAKVGLSGGPVLQPPREDRAQVVNKKKAMMWKPKSMSHMSFVTRFYLCLRVPELDLAGVNPRDASQYWRAVYGSVSNEVSSEEDDDNSEESDSDEDDKDNVFEGLGERIPHGVNKNKTVDDDEKNILGSSLNISEIQMRQRPSTSSKSENLSDDEKQWLELDIDSQSTIGSGEFPFDTESEDSSSVSSEVVADIAGFENGRERKHVFQVNSLPFQIRLSDGCEDGQVKCQHCGRVFSTTAAYASHVKTHFKRKNTCQLCGKEFSRSWLLKGHLRTHTGEKPFVCPHKGCDKAFADKSNLRSHLLIHTVTHKSYTCQKCGRAFAQKRYLHKHMLEVCRVI